MPYKTPPIQITDNPLPLTEEALAGWVRFVQILMNAEARQDAKADAQKSENANNGKKEDNPAS